MADMTLGSVSATGNGCFLWHIPDFFGLAEDDGIRWIWSPGFHLSGEEWYSGSHAYELRTGQQMRIYIQRTSGRERFGGWTAGIQRLDGIVVIEVTGRGMTNCLALPLDFCLSDLRERKSELAPSGNLTISCAWTDSEPSLIDMRPSQSTQTVELWDSDKLSRDFKDLLASGESSDATFRVQGEEFPVHWIILATRAPTLSAMFQHDASERASGIVDIQNCDPDTYREFLEYIYTGKVEELTPKNATDLYEMANRYQVNELKETCLECNKRGLSE